MQPLIEVFERYIERIVPGISKEHLNLMTSKSVARKLQKKEELLTEGEVCYYKIFVTKGLLRNYTISDNGNEYTIRFADAGSWTSEPESYFSGLPSKYCIEALEPAEVVMFYHNDFEILRKNIPELNRYSESLFTETARLIQKRLLINISATAEEKYLDFINTYPQIVQRVPLHMIASYLGLSRETLTRIRQNMSAKTSNLKIPAEAKKTSSLQ